MFKLNYPEPLNQFVKLVSQTNNVLLSAYELESQNQVYDGAIFQLGKQKVRYRKGKLTPKKLGHFVAFWEKDSADENQAYAYETAPDFLVVGVLEEKNEGLFIFPKETLKVNKVYRTINQKGKMGMRFYAPWHDVTSQQAIKTQAWQTRYFVNLAEENLSEIFGNLI